jgi:protoporphyrinogen oxidase
MEPKQTVAVVGGGILGMTIAMELGKKGYDVSIFEAAPSLGGLTKSWDFGGITWDKFYHVILMSDLNTRNLLQQLGIENEINWVETKTGFYTGGELYSMSNVVEFLKFPPLGLISKFRLGLTIFAASKMKDWHRLEKQHVTEWLLKWSGKSTFEKIWLPLLKAKLGDYYYETSAAFIWATIQRMYAARKSGLKKEMFGYVQGGYKRIIETFTAYLVDHGIQIFTMHKLQNLSSVPGKHSLLFDNGKVIESDIVIFTTPSSVIVDSWQAMPPDEKDKHRAIRYMGVSCTSVLMKRSISPYYVTNITENWVPFTGIIEMSALVDKSNFNGKSLIYLPKYVGSEDLIFLKPDEEIHEEFKAALLKMYPNLSADDIIEMKTAKVRKVFALNTLNYSSGLPEIKSSVQGVYYANSAFITNSTLNVNETIDIALKISNLFSEL